jgi:uncharacterized membrane protein YphA (DoxX/SURF4 family)
MSQAKETWTERWYRDWERFWFRPTDPTLLGLIRIGCGILTLYTFIAYSFDLQDFMGPHGWLELPAKMEMVRERPLQAVPLSGKESPLPPPRDVQEQRYLDAYKAEFHQLPPGPYPRNDEEMAYCHQYRRNYKYDLRTFGLPPPQDERQKAFLETFTERFNQPPAPPYPANDREAQEILDYMERQGVDPHRLLAKGIPVWSLWFHITDPLEMVVVHAAFIGVSLLFMIGFCTRITSALTLFANLNYIHRAPQILFGADTMMNILLIYLTIGPSGAALSVDRLLARWWGLNKLRVVNAWRRLWNRAPWTTGDIRPATYQTTLQPLVSANVAIRLLQVHLCIIYLVAGISKLQGPWWWTGTAVWGALANFEMAPMQYELYNEALRFLGHNEIVFNVFLLIGTYFTLMFEIGYAFLIWSPRFRGILLASALLLHGFIGVLMGLRTFTLIMLVMNMAFLRPKEAHWLVNQLARFWGTPVRPEEAVAPEPVPATLSRPN